MGNICVGSPDLTFFNFVLTHHHKYLYHPPQGRKLFQKKRHLGTILFLPLAKRSNVVVASSYFIWTEPLLLVLNHARPKPTDPVSRVVSRV